MEVLGAEIEYGAGQLLAVGSAETDGTAAAALGPKAGLGIHFPPNPLVESRLQVYGQGLGLVRGLLSGYGVWGGVTPGSAETDGTAALGPKAGPGIHFQPKPLAESADMVQGQGLGLVCGAGSG